jgi:gliding-associated putative ABC transporter substrate-binding component GldG
MASDKQKGPQKIKTAANALTLAVALAGGLVLVNAIASRLSVRLDLTQDRVHTLAASSRDAVKNLPDRMTVKAFISSGLQPPLNKYGQDVRDLLDEYAAASGGKLQWEAIDPLAPKKDAEETRSWREELKTKYKIQPITLERISDSKLEIGSDNYLGIAFVYGENIESIPQVAATDGLEYQITSLIRKMTSAKRKKIAFANSEGELTPQQGLQLVGRIVQDYETTTLALDKPIPDDVDVLVIVGPKQPFSDKGKYVIDQFLMKGKPVGLFLDGMLIEQPKGMNMPGMDTPRMGHGNDTNLQDLFDKWGVRVKEDLILDEQNVMGPVPVGGQLYLANYPTFIGVDDKGFSKDFPLTAHLNAIIVPFASSVELTGDLKDGKGSAKATPIAQTTKDHSWRQSGFFVFNPQVKLEKSQEKGPFVLGYAVEGKLASAYPNGPGGTPDTSSPDAAGGLKESPPNTRFIVFGSSGMFNDQQLPIQQVPVYRTNLLFFLNSIDWLAHDDSLIALRVKGMGSRPLTIPPESKAQTWRYVCELGIPFLVILLGGLLRALRTARRNAVQL